MANRRYEYQYETSPRKIEPEYRPQKTKPKATQKKNPPSKKKKSKTKKKYKMSFEMKFFLNSMFAFLIIFAIIACEALAEQRYKEKESLKQQYDELLASASSYSDTSSNIRSIATEYGMETKSATLINLDTSDYIESSTTDDEVESENFLSRIISWIKGIF